MGGRINFFFTEAIRSLSTNIATSLAATLTMFIALFIVGLVWLAGVWVQNQAQTSATQAGQVRVFLNDTVLPTEVNDLRGQLDKMSEVKSIRYLNKDDALVEAKKQFKDKAIFQNLPDNPFPAELRVTLKDPSKAQSVALRMRDQKGVQPGPDGTTYGGELAKTVVTTARWVGIMMIVGIGFFVVAAIFLVRNTIRLSIFARRREIEVMKLVGASNSFVRWPFMIEGLLCGLIAAFTALVLVIGAKSVTVTLLEKLLKRHELHTGGPSNFVIAVGLLGLGAALGSLGSGLSVRKYLRV